jgi:serine/threonine protein kinase
VAVKQLKSEEQSALEELTREAAFMAQLNHDNIVKLHGVVTVCFGRIAREDICRTLLTKDVKFCRLAGL